MAIESVVTPRANFDVGIELLIGNRAHVVCTCVAKHSSTCPVRGEIEGEREWKEGAGRLGGGGGGGGGGGEGSRMERKGQGREGGGRGKMVDHYNG